MKFSFYLSQFYFHSDDTKCEKVFTHDETNRILLIETFGFSSIHIIFFDGLSFKLFELNSLSSMEHNCERKNDRLIILFNILIFLILITANNCI